METKILNPISIKLDKGSGVVLEDKNSTQELSLVPGVVFGNEHYGFVLITNNNGKQKETVYQTQCRIDAIGCDNSFYNNIKVHEQGKYFPWEFTNQGKLKEEASYNPYSRKDKKFVQEVFNTNIEEANEKFNIKVRK